MNIDEAVQKPEKDFTEWRKNQDFDYQRKQSAVMDYLNEHVDYEKLDEIVNNNEGSEVAGLKNVVERLGFSEDSKESSVVKNHLKVYTESFK